MSLRSRLHSAQDEPHNSALNDILFILLFFFLIVSTLANPNVIKLANPKAKSDTKAKQTVVISIDSTQRYFVATRLTPPDSLGAAIAREKAKHADQAEPTVVINADKKADADGIVQVMKAARAAGMKTVLAVDAN